MAVNILSQIYGGSKTFIPHIQMATLAYVQRGHAFRPRVTNFTNMRGFNKRKIAEFLIPPRAVVVAENTAISNRQLSRAQRAEIEPYEIGTRFDLTDRYIDTDLEDALAQVVLALGKGLADKEEIDIINAALTTLKGPTIGSNTVDFDYRYPVQMRAIFQNKRSLQGNDGLMYVGLHPYQRETVLGKFITLQGGTEGINMNFRENSVASWQVPSFGRGIEFVEADFLPRNVKYRVKVAGTGGTFRLSIGSDPVTGQVYTTGAITVSTTPATMAGNIQTALNALSIGTFAVADGGSGLLDLEVTMPADLFVNAEDELQVAIDYVSNPTLDGQKSAYDLVTGTTGTLGKDQYGVNFGVAIEEISAYAKSPVWFKSALVFDERQGVEIDLEKANQGRTLEWGANKKFGVGGWRVDLGGYILSKASAPNAVP